MSYKIPKYPRVMVSLARHKALTKEATSKKVSIAALVESKLKGKK